ncbi:MAG TPA: anti-sigma factor [Bryobacteraceae bacterium]|nr:anti-sigma factor [Bryobacteraceae bacterium]
MTCKDARALLTAYVDSELDVANSIQIQAHLEDCAACARIVDNQQRVRSAIQSSSLTHEPPDEFQQRIRRGVRAESGAARGRSRPAAAWPWIAIAAGVLLAIFVTGKVAFGPSGPPSDLVAQEIVDSHIRSTMPGHLTDVESTDRHTVKPWFNGKLDFAPPVEDFAADGFPLTGGRLDAIGGKTVAALIYRRNRHLINLYVWPSTEPASTPALRAIQGYNLVHWNQAGFACWLVSDLNSDELQQLAARLRGSLR